MDAVQPRAQHREAREERLRGRQRRGCHGIETVPQTPHEHDTLPCRKGFEGGRCIDHANEDVEFDWIQQCGTAWP